MAMLNNRLNIGIPWIGSRDEPETTGFIPHLFHGKKPWVSGEDVPFSQSNDW